MKSRITPYIIWWAIAVHLVWGVALLLDPLVTPVVILVGLHWLIAFGIDGPTLGVLLLVAASIAVISLVAGTRLSNVKSFALLMPQFAVLVAAFISDTQSVISGTVNGNSIDRLLLFTALWPTMAAAALHSVAIIERHIWRH